MIGRDRLQLPFKPPLTGRAVLLLALTVGLADHPAATAVEPSASDPTWLQFAGPLMTDEEIEVFRSLEQHYLQTEFVERFWRSRDPDPSTPRNELRQRWPDRIGTAESQFGGLTSDRGRAFLLNGPPEFILDELCPEILRPIEIWLFGSSADQDLDSQRTLVFHAQDEEDEPGLWDSRSDSIAALFLEPFADADSAARFLSRECRRGREILAALEAALGPAQAYHVAKKADWLEAFEQEVGGALMGALQGSLHFEFPARWQAKTVVDGTLSIGRPPPEPNSLETGIVVDGDIFRGDRRADHFRYHFEILPAPIGNQTQLSFRRHLDPGTYRVLLTARDIASKASLQIEQPLLVPSPVATDSSRHAGSKPGSGASPSGSTFKIRPLPLGLLTGRQRVDVATSDEAITGVSFLLDGQLVMKKSRRPFSVELDLGFRPRSHTLEAVAHDSQGEEIARDSVPINTGPYRFSVRLLEPRQGARYRDQVRVHAEVDLSPDETLDHVELFFNEKRVASLYQPPFVQPRLLLPTSNAAGYVRAVAVLDDGNSAEDLVVINSGGTVDKMQVDFVELFAGVVDRKGRPVENLTREDFSILEDGQQQTIQRFETVRDLPINAGIVLDTSESMIEEIDEAEAAALRFFENVLRPMDRAAVVVFSDEPDLRVPLTGDLRRLAAGLADIEAGGETTLYDSVVFGLYQLLGRRGKRALVLLTDGLDSRSRYDFEETLEFARFTGVAVYSIGIGFGAREIEAQRVLRRLASETGGDCFFIDSADDLERIYTKIEGELRSQYLIGYQSSQSASGEFRRIKLDVALPGAEVKTIPGYYP